MFINLQNNFKPTVVHFGAQEKCKNAESEPQTGCVRSRESNVKVRRNEDQRLSVAALERLVNCDRRGADVLWRSHRRRNAPTKSQVVLVEPLSQRMPEQNEPGCPQSRPEEETLQTDSEKKRFCSR